MVDQAVFLRTGQAGAKVEGTPGHVLTVQADGKIKPEAVAALAAGTRNLAPLAWNAGLADWLQLGPEAALSANGMIGSGAGTMVFGTDTANMSFIGANGFTANLFAFEQVTFQTLGGANQIIFATSGGAAALGFWGAAAVIRQTATGSRGGNAALASLLTALATAGLIIDDTSA